MIKRGDKAKGFRFDTSSGVRWNALMEPFVGVEGIVRQARPKMNELVILKPIPKPIEVDEVEGFEEIIKDILLTNKNCYGQDRIRQVRKRTDISKR